ncbi:MAG: diguanylate cyclase [Psychrosphaera sp.]|nr:diguanylate cyclase [Psychrosphaera sp.]
MTMQNTKPNVLIVDDEKSNLKILSEILKEEANVLIAKNGVQAVAKAKQLRPTLILLDVVMPEMDGFAVITALKNDERTHSIPVIFITGLRDVDNEEKGFSLGACDYIQKPFHASIVKARVKLHLQLARQCQLLEQLANIDPLTGLANRRKFDQVLELEWLSARRDKSTLSILMIDIDFFKPYNDNYGHPAGDDIIVHVAQTLREQFGRPRDFVGRYGGEEFVVILPNTPGDSVPEKMKSCCAAVSEMALKHEYSSVDSVITISAGGVSCLASLDITAQQAVEAADANLYLAKGSGRNQARWQELVKRGESK